MEHHISLQQPVGTDYDINITLLQFFKRLLNFFIGNKTADHSDSSPEGFQPFPAGEQMLLRQYRGGNKQGRLFSVHYRFKCCPQGHFRLAVAHVAAQEPVHRYGFFHIRLNFGNGLHLVRRFLKGEAFLKLTLQIRVRPIGIPVGNFPQGIKTDQLLCQLGYSRGSFGLHAFPVGAAHFG